tara:strand:- start:815 stop:928 length:114 start_codon:yes stop_codon:yes gene_type:complete
MKDEKTESVVFRPFAKGAASEEKNQQLYFQAKTNFGK